MKLYGICNLVNLDINTINQDSSINFGNTKIMGDTFELISVGGNGTVGDFTTVISADENNNIVICDKEQEAQHTQTQQRNTKKNQGKNSNSSTRKTKQQVVNIVDGLNTKSYTKNKSSI